MGADWKQEWKPLAGLLAAFLAAFYLPVGWPRFDRALMEALHLTRWYAREHVVLCLLPAFYIAGAISVFVSQASVMKYLGASAPRAVAYGVASVSGTVLAVCSCTVLPLFAGIWKMGAGLGPATAFLYSGPAINALAILMTARVLGLELGAARTVGAVLFSVVVGVLMHLIFRREEEARTAAQAALPEARAARPLRQNAAFLATMVAILVFANWARPGEESGFWRLVFEWKWPLTGLFSAALAVMLVRWFGAAPRRVAAAALPALILAAALPRSPLASFSAGIAGLSWLTSTSDGEVGDWFKASWEFGKQISPLLLLGVLAAGFLLGRPGREGLIPSDWVTAAVGGNSFAANLLSALIGAFMYFATLTEIPILQGLIGSGMGKGPALALLLAGPALSLPNMLVLHGVMGAKKTAVYVSLVVVMATATGFIYGALF